MKYDFTLKRDFQLLPVKKALMLLRHAVDGAIMTEEIFSATSDLIS